MVDQAKPNIQPGGVQGALFKPRYQSEAGPLFIKKLPSASAPKFSRKNNINLPVMILFNFCK